MNGVSVEEKTITDIFAGEEKYVVPLYQREYAWTDHEVGRLLADIWESYRMEPSRNYYIGTLVVKPDENGYQVIDGQQRLTTLSILYSLIGDRSNHPVLRFANREEADAALDVFYTVGKDDALLAAAAEGPVKEPMPKAENELAESDAHVLEALDVMVAEESLAGDEPEEPNRCHKSIPVAMMAARTCIKGFRPSLDDGSLGNMPVFDNEHVDIGLCNYILNKVKLFRVCMQNVDAMSYFEVMNNRGEQLQYHELLKERLVAGLREFSGTNEVAGKSYDELAEIYDRIWTACSYMDGNLLDHLHICFELEDGKHWWQLTCESRRMRDIEDEEAPPWERQSVIRDFSNFLMHVLRLYVKNHDLAIDVPLDERRMQAMFEDSRIRVNPVEFLDLLIKTRLNFDKYIVKAKMVNDEVEKWRLKEVVSYGRGKNKTYDATNTYSDRNKLQQIICLQSALQVSNAEQRYKAWVYAVLSMSDEDRGNPDRMIGVLEDLARKRIVAARENLNHDGYDLYACGLRTPRLFLNIIDYLMWCENPSEFVFRYYNSIEHHHPQHDNREGEQWQQSEIDEIGNLYLISSSDNSSMSNTPASGKVALYRNNHGGVLPDYPKRKYMYTNTDGDGWTKQKMQALTQKVKNLMTDFLGERNEAS